MAYVEIEVDLEDFDTRDLLRELRHRGYKIDEDDDYREVNDTTLVDLYEAKRYNTGKFDELFSNYIWEKLGKIV